MKLSPLPIGIGIAFLAAFSYWYFFTGENDVPISATPAPGPAEERFLTLAGELSPISFDTSIFTDPRFLALVDLATPITPEIPGRADPFAPLGR